MCASLVQPATQMGEVEVDPNKSAKQRQTTDNYSRVVEKQRNDGLRQVMIFSNFVGIRLLTVLSLHRGWTMAVSITEKLNRTKYFTTMTAIQQQNKMVSAWCYFRFQKMILHWYFPWKLSKHLHLLANNTVS